jgi:hypothetical protein
VGLRAFGGFLERVDGSLDLGTHDRAADAASNIVFGIIVLNTEVEHRDLMAVIVVCTVLLSVFAHGLTARPLANWLASRQ